MATPGIARKARERDDAHARMPVARSGADPRVTPRGQERPDLDPTRRPGQRTVILEADDLGLLYAFNEGIRRAYQAGGLTSTCLRANGYAYEHAVHEILPACPGLGVGIHLCLNEARHVAPAYRVPLLVGHDGFFRNGYYWLMKLARKPRGRRQVEREFRAQIEKVLDDGVNVDHLNSHQHVTMIPEIFRITCRLAREYGIPCVRLVRELPYAVGGLGRKIQPFLNTNYVKHLLLNRFARVNELVAREYDIPVTDYFVGVNYTSHMDLGTVVEGLKAVPSGSVEVLLHPAIGPDPRDVEYPVPGLRRYVGAPQRAVEVDALSLPALYEFLQRDRWMATTFDAWAAGQELRRARVTAPHVPEPVRRLCNRIEVGCPPWVSAARADSRAFAQLVITQAAPGQRVLDLGSGTGIIAICLAKMGRDVVASDISRAAVRTTAANALRNGVLFPCCHSDLLASVDGRFDWIAFNPPYSLGPDTFVSNVARNLLRRVPWISRTSGLAMPRPVLRYHQQLIGRLMTQARNHLNLNANGGILIHAYESEVTALTSVLPHGSEVEILRHPALTNQTVGMVIRLPAPHS
jgi:predicted glycoside hydrolase/deacetylase ChbG (UPF0249 family)/predicted RNA methylase